MKDIDMPRKIRDYKDEYDKYHSTSEQKKNRAMRNAARTKLTAEGRIKKGDGKDIDHKKPLSRGGTNSSTNLRVVSKNTNRSYKRTAKGAIK